MRIELLSLCESFIKNRDAVKSIYRMESAYLHPVCATIFMNKGIEADTLAGISPPAHAWHRRARYREA